MAESVMLSNTVATPQTTYLKDYQPPVFFVDDIHLEFDLQDNYTKVTSLMHIRHNRHTSNLSHDLVLNGEELALDSIKLNGQPVPPSQYDITNNLLTLRDAPEIFDLEIITIIHPEKNTALSGLYRSAKTYCTQCEAEGFRRITFFPDRPDVLTRYTTTIIADEKQYPYLLSNGNLIDSGKLPKGRHFAKWEDPFKKPCYLFALVAGDFDLLEDTFTTQSGSSVQLKVFVEKGYGDQSGHAMYSIKQAMRWDETAYGREYDLDVYMIVAIGDFNMGAMENKGLNIFNTKYVLAKPETATDDDYIHIMSVVAHEYFHNWTGNRVTCRDWFQLSLKEGLTIFRDQSFSEDMLSRAVMRIRDVIDLRETQFAEDMGPLAHPVRPESYIEINNFYTATVYNKGAEVLRMLQTIIGKTLHRSGMDLYFARHDGQAVTIDDYVQIMEDVSGMDLRQFKLWYSQAGTPVVKAEDHYDEQQKIYTLTLSQTCPPTPGQSVKKPMHIPVRIGLLDKERKDIPLTCADGSSVTDKVLHLTEAKQTFQFDNITTRPIPSLLRNFSAPVKLQYAYSDAELLFLFNHDSDLFNRWEAGQQYLLRLVLRLVNDYRKGMPLTVPQELIDAFQYVLQEPDLDKWLKAEMILMPSEKYIGEQVTVVDVEAIHTAREFVLTTLAAKLELILLDIYKQLSDSNGGFSVESISNRQLKNRCLAYLMLLPQHAETGWRQFEKALQSNMTDTLAALNGLTNIQSPWREKALERFYVLWKNDALVMDKWFAVQAASKLPDTLQRVKELTQHPAFDIKNPNKVYALIGAFGQRNPIHFHAAGGEGYVFLRSIVQELDKLNPQVAARMVKPLTSWQRYDKERQGLMRQQLERLLQDNRLSPDVFELVTKSLN